MEPGTRLERATCALRIRTCAEQPRVVTRGRVKIFILLALLTGCDGVRREKFRGDCQWMTCPAPTRPLLLDGYKSEGVCVCVPPEDPGYGPVPAARKPGFNWDARGANDRRLP